MLLSKRIQKETREQPCSVSALGFRLHSKIFHVIDVKIVLRIRVTQLGRVKLCYDKKERNTTPKKNGKEIAKREITVYIFTDTALVVSSLTCISYTKS